MEWTSGPPSEEGHYWYYDPDLDILDTVRVYEKLNPGALVASGSMFDGRQVDTMNGRWAGPLVPPDIEETAPWEQARTTRSKGRTG